MKDKKYKYSDYEISPPGEEYEDGNGDVDIIEQGFICPVCSCVCGAIGSAGGIMGCSGCNRVWERDGGELKELDQDDI